MTTVQTIWLPPAHDKWSGGILQRLFAGDVWRIPGLTYEQVSPRSAREGEPAVVIVAGEDWQHRVKVAELNRYLKKFPHVVVIVIADEGSAFPWERVVHDSMRMWIQTPRPGVHPDTDEMFYLGFGWHPDTPDVLAALPEVEREDWFFAGQITHASRRELAEPPYDQDAV